MYSNVPRPQLASGALPTGFVGVINTPGGGASRNIRRPNLIPGVKRGAVDDS